LSAVDNERAFIGWSRQMLFYWVGERGSGISHRLKATLLIHRRKNLLVGVFLDLPIAVL